MSASPLLGSYLSIISSHKVSLYVYLLTYVLMYHQELLECRSFSRNHISVSHLSIYLSHQPAFSKLVSFMSSLSISPSPFTPSFSITFSFTVFTFYYKYPYIHIFTYCVIISRQKKRYVQYTVRKSLFLAGAI